MEAQINTFADVKVLALNGRFDAYNASIPRQWIEEATVSPPAKLVVNLRDVEFMDLTALSVLVQGVKRARNLNGIYGCVAFPLQSA